MKARYVLLGGMTVAALHAQVETDGKAERYHAMLLKKPENAVVFGRFMDAWLESGDTAGLKTFLEDKAKAGGAMDWRLLAVFRSHSGDEAGAVEALDEALKKEPDDAGTRLARAKALGASLRFEDALADLEIAAKDAEQALEAGTLRGKFLARAGRPTEAVKAWKEVIAANPKDEGLVEDLIELEIGEGMMTEAVATARDLATKTQDPYKQALRRLRVAEILNQSGKREEALAEYRAVFAVSAEDSWLEREVLGSVASIFGREEDVGGLKTFYDGLREEYPRRVGVKKEAAKSLLASGKTDEAVEMFREVLKVLPGDRAVREEFVSLLEAAGRNEDAAAELQGLVATADKDAALWERLAGLFKKLGNKDEMNKALDKVAALAAADESGRVSVAALYERYERREDAEKILREAVKAHGQAGEAGEALTAFLVKDKPDEAVAMWRETAAKADAEGLLRISRALSSNGKPDVAFEVLKVREAELKADPVFLMALCQAAQLADKSEETAPVALELVRMAKTTNDLESALKVASSILSRTKEPEQWRKTLSEKEDASVPELCLLAELIEGAGDSIGSAEVLKKAMAKDGGMLAASQRVRLHEMRGELAEAIAALREWMAMPGGAKAAQLKKLTDLLEKSGDSNAALAETENWKKLAPGDQQAWMRRVEIFSAEGQPEKAVAELRRVIAKFGGDEEMKGRLAEAQLAAGMTQEAWQLYLSLYNEAASTQSKMKWAVALAGVAKREGREEELMADFRKRARENATSTAPLLGLAELHREWGEGEQEIGIVREALRRKPDDITLMLRLADLEENQGSAEKAGELLRAAMMANPTPEARRRLAIFLIRNGDTEQGYAELIAGRVAGNPRDGEKMAITMLDAEQLDAALKILDGDIAEHPEDWRLRHLRGIVLQRGGDNEKAFDEFAGQLGVANELPGVKAALNPGYVGWMRRQSETVDPAIIYQLLKRSVVVTDRNRGNMGIVQMTGQNSDIALPGTTEEARLMSLARALAIAEGFEDKDERKARLASSAIDGIETIVRLDALSEDEVKERLMSDKVTKSDYFWYSGMISFGSNAAGQDQALYEHLYKVFSKTEPELALGILTAKASQATYGRGEFSAADAEAMFSMINALPQEKAVKQISPLWMVAFRLENSPPELKKKAEEKLMVVLGAPEGGDDENIWLFTTLPMQLLREGRFEEAFVWMNKERPESMKKRLKSMGYGYQSHYSSNQQIDSPRFPHVMASMIDTNLWSTLEQQNRGGSGVRGQLMKMVGGGGGRRGEKEIDLEAMAPFIPKAKDPLVRMMMWTICGKNDSLAAEVAELEKGPMNDPNIVRTLAAYHRENDPVKAYNLMVKARGLAQPQELNKQVDMELAALGVLVAGKDGVDLDPARRAVLRLRKPMSMEEHTKTQLANTMRSLGMTEESERYTATPVRPSGSRSRYNVRGGIVPRSGGQGNDLGKLVAEGKKDAAARRLLIQLAAIGKNPNGRYERDNLLNQVKALKIETEVLAAAKPVAGASYERRKQYAQLLIHWKKNSDALPLLKSMTAERPQDFEMKSLLFGILPPAEQKEAVGALSAADFDKMDEDRFADWLDGIKDRESAGDEFLNSIDAFTAFFEKLPPSGEATRNLSWINYHLVSMFRDNDAGGAKLKPLWSPADPKATYDEARSKRRLDIAKRLYTAMLRHPQTAEQGFMFLTGGTGSLGLTEAETDKAALEAFRTSVVIEMKSDNQRSYGHIPQYRWMWRSSGGGGSIASVPDHLGPTPDEYLAKRAEAGAKLELFPADLVKQVADKNPKRGAALANAVKVTGSSGTAAVEAWLKGAKKDSAVFTEELVWVMKVGACRNRRDLLEPLIEPASEVIKGAQQMNGSVGSYQLIASLGQAVALLPDMASRTAAMEKITVHVLGPKESWKLFGSLGDGMNNYTPGVNERIYAYSQLMQAFAMTPKARMAGMRFLAESGLQGMGRMMDDRLSSSYNKDAEQYAREFLEVGLFAPGPAVVMAGRDGNTLLSRAIKECEQRNNDKKEQSAAAMLLAVEGPDRFWARLTGARLSNDVAKAEEEIRAGSATVMKWTPEQKTAFAIEMNQWFPGIGARLDGPLRGLFEKSEKTGDVEAKKQAEAYLKDGFPQDMHFYSLDRDMGPLMGRLAAGEPELAAKLWMKVVNHVSSTGRGGTSSYNGFQRNAAASAHCELFEGLMGQTVPVPSLARLLAEIESQKPDVSFTASYNFDDLPEPAVHRDFERRKAQVAGEKAVAKLSPALRPYAGYLIAVSRETPKEARGALIGLLASYGFTAKVPQGEVANYITWVKEEFKKTDPDLADAMMFSLRYLRMSRESGYDMKLIMESMLPFMTNESVPLDFRLSAAIRVYGHDGLRKVEATPELGQAISKALRQYVERNQQWANSDIVGLLNRTLDADVITKEDAQALSTTIKRKQPTFERMGGGGDGERQVGRMSFGLAMKGGDAAAMNEAAKVSAGTLRGDLSLIVKCLRAGAPEAAGTLVARPGEFHRDAYWMYRADDKSKQPVPAFSKEIEAALPGWLAGVSDPAQRFRLECILSSARDAKEADAPKVPLRERMAALIKRFPAEAPQPKAARMETLLALGEDRQAMKVLGEDYRAVTRGVDYGSVLVSRNNDNGQYSDDESYLNEGLIRRALWLEIDTTGDGTILLQHIRSLSTHWHGDTQYHVSGPIGSLGSWFTAFYLLKVAELPPERLKEEIPKAKEMATILLSREHRNANTAAVALAIGIHALSGDGESFDKWFAGLPEESRARYNKMRDYKLRWTFSFYKDQGLRAPEFAERRKALLKALLNDKATVARELKHMTDISSLMDSGGFSVDEMTDSLSDLAADHPKRAEFLCERAGIIGWRKGEKENAFKVYDEAEAVAAGDEKTLAFVRTYRSWYMKDKLGDRAGALAIAKEVKLDLLPEAERTKTEKMIAELSAKK